MRWAGEKVMSSRIVKGKEAEGRHIRDMKFSLVHILLLFSHLLVSDSFKTLWTVAHQTPLSMRFPRQEYWSGLSFLSPGDLPSPGIKPTFPALAGRFFTTEPPGKPISYFTQGQSQCLSLQQTFFLK